MVGSVATSPVSRQATRSRGDSSQALPSRRPVVRSAIQASLAATEPASSGTPVRSNGPVADAHRLAQPRRLGAGPVVRPQDPRAQGRPSASDQDERLPGAGASDHVDRAEPVGAARSRTWAQAADHRRPPRRGVLLRPPGGRVDGLDGATGDRATRSVLVPERRLGDAGAQVDGEDHGRARSRPAPWPWPRATAPGRWPGPWPGRRHRPSMTSRVSSSDAVAVRSVGSAEEEHRDADAGHDPVHAPRPAP